MKSREGHPHCVGCREGPFTALLVDGCFLTTPVLQAKGLYLLLEVQQRIADELLKAFPGQLDPITAAMTGSLIGAIQQASLASVRLGRSQDELWEAARHGLDIAVHGLLSVRPPTESP